MELTTTLPGATFGYLEYYSDTEKATSHETVLAELETENSFERFELRQNYPNPFNPSTTIRFQLPAATQVQVTIHDITGRKVAELLNAFKPAGEHTLQFNAAGLASGTYLYRVQAGNAVLQNKMLLLK